MALTDQTVEADMAKDWAAISEKYAIEEPEPEAGSGAGAKGELTGVAGAVNAEPDETPEPARARDDSGKFVKQDKVDSKEEPPAAGGLTAEGSARQATEPSVPATAASTDRDINRAPSTWKPTARAEYDKLPPAIKAEVHRREQDFLNGQTQVLPDAKFGKDVRAVVEPYRMLIEAEGGTPEKAIGNLLRTAAIFRVGTPQQKMQALAGIAQQYGVDLQALAPQPGQPPPAQSLQDPRVDQLLQQLNQERQGQAQREQQQLEAVSLNWLSQADEKGAPLRPYLGDVMNEMNLLVPQIRQSNPSLTHEGVLQEAYDRATWGNPEIRTLLIQQQGQGQTQVREADNQNRVREARRAASVNVPRRASVPSPGKPGTLDDTLRETARALGLMS